MARIRSVKPEFWVDRSFVRKVPNRDARFLYMALWNLADEHARLMGDPAYVKGQAFPYVEDDDLTPKVVDDLLDMLATAGRVVRYEVDGDPYLFLPRLAKHQRLESAKVPSRLPPPPDPDDPAPRPDKSAPDPDGSAPHADMPIAAGSSQVSLPSEVRADKSARDSDESARGADKSALFYVAGCMEQVAGSRDNPSLSPTATPAADEQQDAVEEVETGESPAAAKPKKAKKPEPQRDDVDALCNRLVELMLDRGCREPTITDAWRAEARLLLDKDRVGHKKERITLDKAMKLLEWSQGDWFWKSNILSIPKFRKQYDALREKALAEWERGHLATLPPQRASTTDQRVAEALALADELRAEEDADRGTVITIDFSQRRELTA